MFKRIMTPVDLGHLKILDRALKVAAEEARHHGIPVTYVTVTANTPGPLGHTPEEKQAKLDAFVAEQAGKYGIEAQGHLILAHDPRADIDDILTNAADEVGADLVIMASHKPQAADYFWPSNGGRVAGHAKVSVFIVRDN
jgi:nucleotide-binding universal stress UspA family protein